MTHRWVAIVVALLLPPATSCGDASLEPPAVSSTTSTTPESPTAVNSSVTTDAPDPSVLALSSGRGDDGSLDVVVWLAADPFAVAGHRVVIGTDADESYPGVGDPLPHLDGWLEVTGEGATLYDGAEEVASGETLSRAATWVLADGALRVFFIGTVPTRAGMLWVFVEVEGEPVVAGVAGAPVGERCSHHGAGVDVPEDPAVPDAGTPCRYRPG